MKTVTVLGSTGSIGGSTLDLIAAHKDMYDVVALTGGRNVEALARQALAFRPRFVAIADEGGYAPLKQLLSSEPSIEIAAGSDAVVQAAALGAEWTMAAIVGVAGLPATLQAISGGRIVAFASKECLVAAGPLMMDAVKKSGATLLPVDSEHNAIFQVFDENNRQSIERLVLTASGGPFLNASLDDMRNATPEQAVKHPNWSMGAKISVDSASMMNKALEVIEAHHLFSIEHEKIDVVVHPQSTIHSMVEYADGSFLAQLGPSDMRTPISYCLGWPRRIMTSGPRLDLATLSRLDFMKPDLARFPSLALVREVLDRQASAAIAFNAANEVAVAQFLDRRIGFARIVDTVARVVARTPDFTPATIDEVAQADVQARNYAQEALKKAA